MRFSAKKNPQKFIHLQRNPQRPYGSKIVNFLAVRLVTLVENLKFK